MLDKFVNFFAFGSYFGFIKLLAIFISIQIIIFWVISRIKNERKWNKIFYHSIEAFEDSYIPPEDSWSYLIDPNKFMNFDYKNKLKWIKFDQPLKLNSKVKIKVRYGSILRGYITAFEPNKKLCFEYFAFPSATRYFWEIEMVTLEDKTRYILRIKIKKLLVPLINKLFPKLSEKMKNLASNILHNSIKTCGLSSKLNT